MKWHIHKWRFRDSVEEVVKTFPNGARKVRTTCSDECAICGKHRRCVFRFSTYYRPGEKTGDEVHRETMAQLRDWQAKLGAELESAKSEPMEPER